MNVKGFVKTSLIDYPGEISSVIFLEGCNLRCSFCHNVDLLETSQSEIYPIETVLNILTKRFKIISSIVISGGEPLINNDIVPLLKKLKQYPFKIKLDTNGFFPSALESIINQNLLDYVAVDIKTSPEKYEACTGNGNFTDVLSSLNIIKKSGIEYEVRTTCVPKLVTGDDFEKIGKAINHVSKYYLQQFRNETTLDPSLQNTAPYSKEILESFLNKIIQFSNFAAIRGI